MPKSDGATATPHGASSLPPAATRCSDQDAARVVQVHDTEAGARRLVVGVRGVVLRVGHDDSRRAGDVDRLNAERRIAGRQGRVGEPERRRVRLFRIRRVKHVDLAVVEVGGVEEIGAAVVRDREAFVNGAVRRRERL